MDEEVSQREIAVTHSYILNLYYFLSELHHQHNSGDGEPLENRVFLIEQG
jgi:hypothetical protein